ncbi:MAG: RHS repeat-associated core domain-containing protein [Nocardioides sp.]
MTLLAADHHGTGEAQLDAYSASYVTRKFTPFGGTRGGGTSSGTASATWRGDHGFLDKPVDATSGLTQVGARYYDNGIGSFISVDPLLDTNDPHQANAYNYARNNPLTYSDPTGLMCADGCGAGGSSSRSYDSLAGVSEGSPRGLGTETPNVSSPGSTTPVVQAKPSGLKKILFTVAGATVDFKIAFTQRLMRWSDTSLKRLMFANRTRSILIRSRNGTIGKVPPSTAARADLRLLNASKWASRGLGVIGAGVSFGLAKAEGDGNTEAALKTSNFGSWLCIGSQRRRVGLRSGNRWHRGGCLRRRRCRARWRGCRVGEREVRLSDRDRRRVRQRHRVHYLRWGQQRLGSKQIVRVNSRRHCRRMVRLGTAHGGLL